MKTVKIVQWTIFSESPNSYAVKVGGLRSLQPPHFACGFVPVAAFGALHSAAAKRVKTNDFVGIRTFKIDDFVGKSYNKTNDFVGICVFKTNDFVVNSILKINDFVGDCQNGF